MKTSSQALLRSTSPSKALITALVMALSSSCDDDATDAMAPGRLLHGPAEPSTRPEEESARREGRLGLSAVSFSPHREYSANSHPPTGVDSTPNWCDGTRPPTEYARLPGADVIEDHLLFKHTVKHAPGGPNHDLSNPLALHAEVPRIIHHALHDEGAGALNNEVSQWKKYAELFNYEYRQIKVPSPAETTEQWPHEASEALQRKSVKEALDLACFSSLYASGGIIIRQGITPPKYDNHYINFSDITPTKGFIFAAQRRSRTIGGTSVWLSSDFMMASRHHPVIEHIAHQAKKSSSSWKSTGDRYRIYATGSIFLSQAVGGTPTVIPARFLDIFDFHITHE